jgi:hypothetical protein
VLADAKGAATQGAEAPSKSAEKVEPAVPKPAAGFEKVAKDEKSEATAAATTAPEAKPDEVTESKEEKKSEEAGS